MRIDQFAVENNHLRYSKKEIKSEDQPSFVLVFASRKLLESPDWLVPIENTYPNCEIVSCSTSGEVYRSELREESITAFAVSFEKSSAKISSALLKDFPNSRALGAALAAKLEQKDLSHVLVFADGWLINGSDLIQGMHEGLNSVVKISGGLAGDGANFSKTLVGVNRQINEGMAIAIGLYGDQLKVGFGAHGGWSELGEKYTITQADGREILSLDGKQPLALYREFLGDEADGLPGSALLHPAAVWLPGAKDYVVRTVFGVDEFSGSITLGEAVKEGSELQFLRAQFDDLTKGLSTAAELAISNFKYVPQLTILVSCIGRKLLFDKHIEEEIIATQKTLGANTSIAGFYSYGEICPEDNDLYALHHQTLALTLLSEVD